MSTTATPRVAIDPAPVGYRKWICTVCDFVYDEALGLPEQGIPPGTRLEEIPDSWACPDCGVTKADFEPYMD